MSSDFGVISSGFLIDKDDLEKCLPKKEACMFKASLIPNTQLPTQRKRLGHQQEWFGFMSQEYQQNKLMHVYSSCKSPTQSKRDFADKNDIKVLRYHLTIVELLMLPNDKILIRKNHTYWWLEFLGSGSKLILQITTMFNHSLKIMLTCKDHIWMRIEE